MHNIYIYIRRALAQSVSDHRPLDTNTLNIRVLTGSEGYYPITSPVAAPATMGVRGSPGEDPGWSKLACRKRGGRQLADGRAGARRRIPNTN